MAKKKLRKKVKEKKVKVVKIPNTFDELEIEDTLTGLNPRQERFCQLYATDKEFFGNGAQTYIEVYDADTSKPNWYKTACQSASRLLTNAKVCKRINELLTVKGLNDEFVDKQTLFLITQHSDLGIKLGAIREYNNLKQRITKKVDLTTQGEKITGFNYLPPNDPNN